MKLSLILLASLTVFYGFGLWFGKRLRDWRDANEFQQTIQTYFNTASAQGACLCDKADCDCDAQTDKHRDDQQTTD